MHCFQHKTLDIWEKKPVKSIINVTFAKGVDWTKLLNSELYLK